MIDMSRFEGEMRVANVNLRSERHGEAHRPAVDVKLEWVTSSEVLDALHAGMRAKFYRKDTAPAEPTLPGMEPMALEFPELEPLGLKVEETGLTLRIVHGLSGSSDLVFKDCTAQDFKVEMLPGGSVEITVRVSTTDVDEKRLGKLGLLIKSDVPVRIERQDPPQADNITPLDKKRSNRDTATVS